MLYCPYCFSKLPLSSNLESCEFCKTKFKKRISDNLTNKDITLTLIGNRSVGKSTYLSVLFYLIEKILPIYEVGYEYLDNKGFEYIFENVSKIKNNQLLSATSLNFDTLLISLFRGFFNKKFIISLLDTPGEVVEKEDYLFKLDISNNIFKSENLFLFIDSDSFFNSDDVLYTGFISRYLSIRDEKKDVNNKNVVLIFTKADKMVNYFYKYKFLEDYLDFSKKIENGIDLSFEEMYENLKVFSNHTKEFIRKEHKKVNFLNLLEYNFENVGYFFVSALGNDKFYNKSESFGVLNPLIYLVGLKNEPNAIVKFFDNVFDKVLDKVSNFNKG